MDRLLQCLLVLSLLSQPLLAKVEVQLEPQPITVKTAQYEARIEPDGCLTDLKLGGINYFAPGVGISRGSYFYQNGPVKLEKVELLEDQVVEASSERASIRYEFADDKLTATLTNNSESDMVFFVVLNGLVGGISLEDGDLQKTAISGNHSQASVFIDKHRLEIKGFTRLWGPWQGPHQVVETSLKPVGNSHAYVSTSRSHRGPAAESAELQSSSAREGTHDYFATRISSDSAFDERIWTGAD